MSETPLLQLAESCLAQSFLIFLVADMRLLSATGRISTRYETLAIDSDFISKTTARDFCGYNNPEFQPMGLSPAQIMAVLMLELSQEVDLNEGGKAKETENKLLTTQLETKQEGRVEKDMNSLLKGYADMIIQDLAADKPKIKRADMDTILPTENEEEDDEAQNQFETSFIDLNIADFEDEGLASEDEELFAPGALRRAQSIRRKANRQEAKNKQMLSQFKEIQSAVFHQDSHSSTEFYRKDELKTVMEKAVKSKDQDRLSFMKEFFREGTVSRVMAESNAELVWLQDWHSSKECIYAISIDRENKTVLLAFRGAITRADWAHIWDWNAARAINPIDDPYPSRLPTIKMHNGFYRYLFRQRKDTGTTKYDEIAARLEYYMDLVGQGCKLLVTGHSLGAALSVVFSFYASTEERFTRSAPVEVVNFGCPLVAGYQLADAFRHQEDAGKLRLARIRCKRDGVPHGPPILFRMSKRGAAFHHVGIDVHMPMIRKNIFRYFGQPQPKIKYMKKESFVASYIRQIKDYYFWNIPVRPWMIAHLHSLDEHQQRLLLIDRENSPLVKCTLGGLYAERTFGTFKTGKPSNDEQPSRLRG